MMVYESGWKESQLPGETIFLGVAVRVFLEEIYICIRIGSLSKENLSLMFMGSIQSIEGSS
jgi:hypothetical protein